MTTQAEKILKALKEARGGLHPTYFIQTLYVYQYNARIHELRAGFGCECKNGDRCSAQEHIRNKRLADGTTIFMYERSGSHVDWDRMRQDLIMGWAPKEDVTNCDQPTLL